MGYESIYRIFSPVEIHYNQSILVAVLGLIVNLVSVFLLKHDDHHHSHDHHHHDHEDLNLKSAYFHVLADSLTSGLAIIALLCAKYFQTNWMDPVMGIIGAILVIRWSIQLLKITSSQLLDEQGDHEISARILSDINQCIKNYSITDFHLWLIGPGIYNVNISITTSEVDLESLKKIVHENKEIVHSTIEIYNP